MKMPPPPPAPPPAPPKPWYGDEPEVTPVSPDLSRQDLEAAIWIHGGYPQVPYADAARTLLSKCRKTPFGRISPAAILTLDRQLPTNIDLSIKFKDCGYDF